MNVNDYEIEWLTDRVILITWHKSPMDPNVTTAYIRELHEILYSVTEPIFFLSDLRKGRIQDVRALQGLAELTKHKNWGGGASFSQIGSCRFHHLCMVGLITKKLQKNTKKPSFEKLRICLKISISKVVL